MDGPVRTILVVEDSDDTRELLALLFQDSGYRVLCAALVGEALRLLRASSRIDVLLTDYNLPDGNGGALIQQARNEGLLDHTTPVLICTAYAQIQAPPHVVILKKPIDPTALLREVQGALAHEEQEPGRTAPAAAGASSSAVVDDHAVNDDDGRVSRVSIAGLTPGRLAWLLVTFQGDLLKRWKARVLADPDVPDANRLSAPALEDHIPELIERLLLRLARHPPHAWGERVGRELGGSEVGLAHAQQRFAVHYTLSEALRELSHFRAAVLDLCAEHGVVPSADESNLLHATIDEMMATSATTLERSSRSLYEQAMGVVAHDLRNPLNTIAMYAARLLAGSGEVDLVKAGEVLTRSARTMGRLVDDLLQYSKLEAGHFSIRAADVDVCELALEAREQCNPAARRRKVELAVSTPSVAVHVLCDHDRILQALENLVGNAIQFTPKGGRVRIEIEAKDAHCLFRVADTGPGISPEHVEDVFRPFWQAPGTSQGAGLGLAIARSIVEAHGGTIGIESHAPSGASFAFALPYKGAPKESASFRPHSAEPIPR